MAWSIVVNSKNYLWINLIYSCYSQILSPRLNFFSGFNEVEYIEKLLLKRNLRLIMCVLYNMAREKSWKLYGI